MSKKLTVFITFFALALSVSAQAADKKQINDNIAQVHLSLDPGTYSYSLDMRDEAGVTTAYFKLVETPINLGKTAVSAAIGSIPFAGGVLAGAVSSESIFEILSEKAKGAAPHMDGINEVVPLSALVLADASAKNSSELKRMKTGTVKFFNESKGLAFPALDPKDLGTHMFLTLPAELQKMADEAQMKGIRVILILQFEIQEGKKGLNAVNVKKA